MKEKAQEDKASWKEEQGESIRTWVQRWVRANQKTHEYDRKYMINLVLYDWMKYQNERENGINLNWAVRVIMNIIRKNEKKNYEPDCANLVKNQQKKNNN